MRLLQRMNKGKPANEWFTKPLKQIRKTSATLIENHEHFGRYVPHYLGHVPQGVAARHYSAPSIDLFDRIVAWLGQQYGFLPKAP